jgi:hypothetical protein
MSEGRRTFAGSSGSTVPMQNDDDLRGRFKSLAKEDAAAAPAFSRPVGSHANVRTPRWRSSLRPLAGVAVSVAAVVVALVLGMAWGTNTGYASARVEGQRERSNLAASTLGAAGQLTVLRLDLARTRAEFERQAKAGGSSSHAVQSASDQLRTIEATLARIEADLARGESARPTNQTIPAGEIPMKRALAMTCSALSIASSAVGGQNAAVRILELPPAASKTQMTLGSILDVRDVGGGRVLVNDGLQRRMLLMDSSLKVLSVPIDSAPGNANSYGPRAVPVVRYIGDSLLTSDMNARTMLVMSPSGQVVRAIAQPLEDFPVILPNHGAAFDTKGRMVFQGFPKQNFEAVRAMSDAQRVAQKGDSTPILRADLNTRRIDTVASLQWGGTTKLMGRATEGGPIRYSVFPIETVDNWALLSDGSLAIVRGQDYHIDWIDADGTKHSTTKLPYDWRRLTDEDKQKLIDSTRTASSESMGRAMAPRSAPPPDVPQQPGARRFVPSDPAAAKQRAAVEYLAPELKDLPDYYPPIRLNSSMPDLDGNLWILPTSSAQSKQGELVYDVVNAKGDFHRVRIPVGKSIAGFGKGGIVYLQSGDRTNGFYLERTRVPK